MARIGSRGTQQSADDTTEGTPTEGTEGTPTEGTPAEGTPTEGDATGLTGTEGTQTPATAEGISAEFIAAPVSLDMSAAPEYVKQSAPQRARSPRQMAMDETVEALHEKWVKAGRPSTWGAIVAAKAVAYYFTPPEQVSGLKKIVNRAKLLHDYAIKWGSDFVATPEMVERFDLPAEYEGRSVVSFAVKDKRPRNAAVTTTAQTAVNGDDDDDDDDDDDE